MLNKTIKCYILLLTLCVFTMTECLAEVQEIKVGDFLRETSLHAITGKSHMLSQYQGKPLFINIWASWCGPCRNEMQSIERLSQKNNRQQFNVIGISVDDSPRDAAALVHKAKLSFENYIDKNFEIENMFGAETIPLTILVGADGRILKKITGSKNWTSPEYIHLIEQSFKVSIN